MGLAVSFAWTLTQLRRADAIEALRIVLCLQIGELKLAGRYFYRGTKHLPIAQRQGNHRCRQHGETCARRAGEPEFEAAVGVTNRVSQPQGGAELLGGERRTGKA